MNDRDSAAERTGRLSQAIREVKIAAAERDDVVVEMREAARMRLELLAQELEPVFAEVPDEEILFDFAISSGVQPRLWIDAVSHVGMGRDRRTYRFVRDTRMGRVVLAESTDMKPIASQVTRYIAERMVERQRWLDGTAEPVLAPRRAETPPPAEPPAGPRAAWQRPPAAAPEAARVAQFSSTAAPSPDRQPPAGFAPAAAQVGPRGGGSLLAYAADDMEPENFEKSKPQPSRLRAFLSGLGIVLFGAASGLAILAAVYYDEVAAYLAAN